jgi:hypothetical protein
VSDGMTAGKKSTRRIPSLRPGERARRQGKRTPPSATPSPRCAIIAGIALGP